MFDFRKLDYWLSYHIRLLNSITISNSVRKISIRLLRIYAPKRNSKRRPPPSWIYFRWLFLTYCQHYASKPNHHTKFRENISIYDRIIITFRFSRWRPSATLDFLKADFWPMHRISLLVFHHGTKFCAKMLIDDKIMAHNRNSRWRPSAILGFLKPDFWLRCWFFNVPLLWRQNNKILILLP